MGQQRKLTLHLSQINETAVTSETGLCRSPLQCVSHFPPPNTHACSAFLNFSLYIPRTIYGAEKQSDHQKFCENINSKVRNDLFQKSFSILKCLHRLWLREGLGVVDENKESEAILVFHPVKSKVQNFRASCEGHAF